MSDLDDWGDEEDEDGLDDSGDYPDELDVDLEDDLELDRDEDEFKIDLSLEGLYSTWLVAGAAF